MGNIELREWLISGAVSGLLLVIVQLESYIWISGFTSQHPKSQSINYVVRYTKDNPEELSEAVNTSFASLGIGLLFSTAISLSSTLADLLLAGANAVRLALRMANHIQHVPETFGACELSESPDASSLLCRSVADSTARRMSTVCIICRESSMAAH